MRGSGSKPSMTSGRDRVAEEALDVAEHLVLVDADERDGLAVDAGAAGPADAVDVVLGDHRQLEVDDVRERVDVEAARGDLGRDEDRVPVGLEVGERADALRLALVAVDGGRGDAVPLELLGEPVRAVLGAREDERLVDAAGLDEVAEQLALALAVDAVDDLLDELGGGVARRDLDRGRLVEEAGGQRAGSRWRTSPRRAGSGGARGSRARILRMSRMKPMSSIRSASSRTRISTARQVDGALADVVEQAARGGDDDLGAGAQGADLRIEADAAVDGDRLDRALVRRRCGRSPRPGARARGSGRGSARG